MAVLVQVLRGVFAVLLFSRGKGENATTWAKLYPDTHFESGGYCEAANAIDGRTNIGESGAVTVLNCASTMSTRQWRNLQYLQIDLQRPYSIAAIRLHLRDGEQRRRWQNGLVVIVSNSTIGRSQTNVGTQCGVAYNPSELGQSPLFPCWASGRYVYAALRHRALYPVQVCEMQIFKVMDLTGSGVATIFPDEVYENRGKKAVAANAVDGLSSIGDSGDTGGQNCAGLRRHERIEQLQYLRIDLGHSQQIYSIRLYLRDGNDDRYKIYEDQNGMVVSISKSSELSLSTYNCGLPYNSTNDGQSPVFVCDSSARYIWMVVRNHSKPLFICEVEVYADVRCSIPASPLNGRYSATRLTHGGSLSVSCDEGFRPSSPEPLICEMSGNWSRPLPACQAVNCGSPERPKNGRFTLRGNVSTYRSVATFSCISGHYYRGSLSAVCQADGQWNVTSPECIPVKCGSPERPKNGRFTLIGNVSTYRSVATFSCISGHYYRGSLSAVCQADGQWNATSPECILVDCGHPTPPANGGYILTDGITTFGSQASYFCHKQYHLVGDTSTQCDGNKQWSNRTPLCKPFCDPPPSLVNGRLLGIERSVKIDVGRSVLYECNAGYALSREVNKRRTCLPNRQWSGTAPFCYEFSCSSCHKDADCIVAAYCRCKQGHVGNGKFCCPKGMGREVVAAGSTALFRCDRSCNVSFQRVTWFRNNALLDFSQTRYGLVHNGMFLYVERVTPADAGEYMCEVHVGEAAYQRYGSLEVTDSQSRNLPACSLDCGRSCARKPLVARSDLAYPGQFPWQAMLCYPPRGQYCGGVLVSPDCIVTAAHCVVSRGINPQDINVCLGRHCGNCSERDSEGKLQCSKSNSVAVHPQYDSGTLDNDIAVMKLKHPPLLDCTSVYPICLPNKTRDGLYIRAHKQGTVTGWGRVDATASKSTCLRKGRVRLVSRRICAMKHSRFPITNSMMCATDYNGACEGDSGGPLVFKNSGYGDRHVLGGIVSWGTGCGKANNLGVYTSVLNHVNWVKNACGIQG